MPTRTIGHVSAYTPMSSNGAGHESDVTVWRARLAKWLGEKRSDAGLSQREVSVRLDVDSQTVSRWETGRHPIPAEAFFAIVAMCGRDAIKEVPVLFATLEKVSGSSAGQGSRRAAGEKRREG